MTMEKRFALALGLSFLFFIVWGKMFPVSTPPTNPQNTKTIENKEDVIVSPGLDVQEPQETVQVQDKQQVFSEEVLTIENDRIRVFISNLGARMVKAEFKEYGGEEFFISSGALFIMSRISLSVRILAMFSAPPWLCSGPAPARGDTCRCRPGLPARARLLNSLQLRIPRDTACFPSLR